LWSAQAVSAFGSRITRTALPIIAVDTLGEPESIVGLLAALQLAPGVLLAVFSGGYVDRGDKRRILIVADLLRAALIASLTFAWALGRLDIIHVIVVGAVVGAAAALDHITEVAYLPAIVDTGQLADGNSKLEVTEAVAEITGPASAGVLIAALGAPLVVVIDGIAYLWSAFMLGRIQARAVPHGESARAPSRSESSGARAPSRTESSGVRRPSTRDSRADLASASGGFTAALGQGDLQVGLRTVFSHPFVRPVVLALMVWSIAGGFFLALYTVFCLRELDLSKSVFGIVIAMGGIGSLAGALVSRALVRAIGLGRTLLVTSALSLALALFIPLAGGSEVRTIGFLIAHQLLADGFAVAFLIQAVTLRQTVLPRHLLGRANAAIHVCTVGILPIAAVIAGVLAQAVGTRGAVWIGVSIGCAAPLFLIPLRKLREMPPAPDT
jgi:MFS family permease